MYELRTICELDIFLAEVELQLEERGEVKELLPEGFQFVGISAAELANGQLVLGRGNGVD